MGLLDVLFGRTKAAESNVDALFAISSAYVTLETRHGLTHAGKAAVCFRPVSSSFFDEARQELEELLRVGQKAAHTAYTLGQDDYGYVWVTLRDEEFEDLVAGVHQASMTLGDHGFRDRLLAAVFAFRREEGQGEVFWVYSYKLGRFYPFAPTADQRRDVSYEVRLGAVMARDLPILRDHAQWYPLWGIPF